MQSKEFQRLASEVDQLTPRPKQLLIDRLRKPEPVAAVAQLIENRFGEIPACPSAAMKKSAAGAFLLACNATLRKLQKYLQRSDGNTVGTVAAQGYLVDLCGGQPAGL